VRTRLEADPGLPSATASVVLLDPLPACSSAGTPTERGVVSDLPKSWRGHPPSVLDGEACAIDIRLRRDADKGRVTSEQALVFVGKTCPCAACYERRRVEREQRSQGQS